MFLIIAIFVLFGSAGAQEMFVVSGIDTGRATTVYDTTIIDVSMGTPPPPIIEKRTVLDTLRISATVGDTVTIRFYAEGWPNVAGYFANVEHSSAILLPDDTRPLDFPLLGIDYNVGQFWNVSVLPTSVSGFVRIDDSKFQVGFQGLGDSKGSGTGQLGQMRLKVRGSGDVHFFIASVDLVSLNDKNEFVSVQQDLGIPVIVDLEDAPEPVTADWNKNGVVDFEDFLAFAGGFGKRIDRDADFDDTFDYDQSGDIGFVDFLLLAEDFGKPPRIFWTRRSTS